MSIHSPLYLEAETMSFQAVLGMILITSGAGADTIHGGPGTDYIGVNFELSYLEHRDFSNDFIDCGSGADYVWISSSEDTASLNCDTIVDYDG